MSLQGAGCSRWYGKGMVLLLELGQWEELVRPQKKEQGILTSCRGQRIGSVKETI